MAEIFKTTEMHCGGEPVRIVESGYPPIPTDTLLNVRKYVREHLDHFRRLLILEPRGHADMYGAVFVKSDNPADLDASVLFLNNSGYSTMCGHATIALARLLADKKQRARDAEMELLIEAPCGPVKAFVAVGGDVRFLSVEAYATFKDVQVELSTGASVTVDVAYGGAYYAVLRAESVGVKFGRTDIAKIISIGADVKKAVVGAVDIKHPVHEELSFLYGVIFTDDSQLDDKTDRVSTNVTVFADGQVDRSPTGSGVTARMALLYGAKRVALGETVTFVSGLTGSRFTGRVVEDVRLHQVACVRVEVGGKAYYTGRSEFVYEPEDPLAFGFKV